MKSSIILASAVVALVGFNSCKKEGCTDSTAINYDKKAKKDNGSCEYTISSREILSSIGTNTITATYSDLASKSSNLFDLVTAFVANPSASALNACRDTWKSTRSAWEQSEAFLFGPVSTNNIDPAIDTWPVDFTAMDSLINSTFDFSMDANMDALDDALKGFHPIEYMLWGQNGAKTFTDFTIRQKEYLVALAKNTKKLTGNLATSWDKNNGSSFYYSFTNPSSTNAFYSTTKLVFEELVNAVAGICGEVAEGKMNAVFIAQDPSLEESPFSQNSMRDFTDNIRGVENVYLGKYTTTGSGLSALVRQYNLSLDNAIKTKITNAISKCQAVTAPFGTAISTQATLVQNAINAINDLKTTLENELLPFVQQHATE
jgi:uncharacterized iron-regulated protein